MTPEPPLVRDLDRLQSTEFDLLVVGGGVHGLFAAYDAAQRGLSVALVERGDFGAASSGNHLRVAHGGLRSLQTGDVAKARESIVERRTLARIAPHYLSPLPFLVATRRSVTRGRMAFRAAFKVDALIGRDRNRDVETALHLPAGQLVSRAVCLRLFPGLRQDGVTGGAMWYEYHIHGSDRLNIAIAAAAAAQGARLANHARALKALTSGSTVRGMRVRDELTGEEFDINAAITLNAAGTQAGPLLQTFGLRSHVPLIRAMNLVTNVPCHDLAVGAPTSRGRMLFRVPWRGRIVVGTSHSDHTVDPTTEDVPQTEVDTFIDEVNAAFPDLQLTRESVTLVQHGLVPAVQTRGGLDLKPRPEIRDHAKDGIAGAISSIGVKYTTARAAAERAVDLVVRKLGKAVAKSRTASVALPGAAIADFEAIVREATRQDRIQLADPVVRHLMATYGTNAGEVVSLMAGNPGWSEPLALGVPTLRAEIIYGVRAEMARTLRDVIVRRTGLGAMEYPGDEASHAAAQLLGAELGWTPQQIAAQEDALRSYYTPARLNT